MSKIISAHSVSFLMKNTDFKILIFGYFQTMLLEMKILKRHLLYVVGVMNPPF